MSEPVDAAGIGYVPVEEHLRLTVDDSQAALSRIVGRAVIQARERLRFGPGRTFEVMARLLDRGIIQAEGIGLDSTRLVVADAEAYAADEVVRIRRGGFGVADWVHTPTSRVRIVLGTARHPGLACVPQMEPELSPTRPTGRNTGEDAVRDSLLEVIDPDLGVNIVDLGFVRGIEISLQGIVITLTLTSPVCPLTANIEKQILDCIARQDFVRDVRVDWQWLPPWHPDDVTDSGREQLRAIGFNL